MRPPCAGGCWPSSAPARTAARWPAAAKASARAAVVLQQAMRPGAAPGHVHRRGAAKGALAGPAAGHAAPVDRARQRCPRHPSRRAETAGPRGRRVAATAGGALGIAQEDAGVGSRLAGSHHPATGAQPCLPIRRQCVAVAPDADLAALGQGMRRQRCGQRPRAPRALQCIQPVLGGGGRSVVRAQPRNGRGRPGRSDRHRLRVPLHVA